jgi:hypothetical protein
MEELMVEEISVISQDFFPITETLKKKGTMDDFQKFIGACHSDIPIEEVTPIECKNDIETGKLSNEI